MQGIHRVTANLEDTSLDCPDAKQQFAVVAAAAASSPSLAEAFSSQGQPREVSVAAMLTNLKPKSQLSR